ncbi:hypothetical protein F5Y05DRAFT_306399 [Hypoxylon sp. FL0543]|nr:hypothetical protein F5Y05DRAFT_306399 [Hypoxylon sp. FL0543]
MAKTHIVATVPIKVFQVIGSKLDTPGELFNLAAMCKHSKSAINATNIFMKDAEYQRELNHQLHLNEKERLDSWSESRGNMAKFPKPSILWAIESNKDVETIRKCINIYREEFPRGLEGKWYTSYPPPMCRAAERGRLDVVKALVESGVSLRNWYNLKYPWCPWDMLKAFYGQFRPPDIAIDILLSAESGDAFKLACSNGHEDVACFMIHNGLEFRLDDLFYAAKEGCLRALNSLLESLDLNNRPLMAQAVLNRLRNFRCARNLHVYKPLLAAAYEPPLNPGEPLSFDRAEWLSSFIINLLNDHYAYRRKKEVFWSDGTAKRYQFKLTPEFNEASYLFSQLIQLDEFEAPGSAVKLARTAAQVDTALEFIQTLLEQYPHSIGKKKSDRRRLMDELLLISVSSGSEAIVKYLLSFGCPFSSYHLEEAIMVDNWRMVDLILSSGIPATATLKGAEYETPLHFALNRWKYASAFRLIDHGADLDDIPETLKDLLLLRFHCHERKMMPSWRVEDAVVDREIFSKRDDSIGYTNLYCEQLHVMYSLIFGDAYSEEATKRFGDLKDADADMSPRTSRLLEAADRDKWELLNSPPGARIDHGTGYGWVVNGSVLKSTEFRGPAYKFNPIAFKEEPNS